MGRSVELSGAAIVYLFYAISLAVVPVVAAAVWPLDDLTSLSVAVLLAALVLLVAADLWYWKRGGMSEHLTTAASRTLLYDVTHHPDANPGQAAKQRWLAAVRRLPGGEDDGDDEGG
jgi:hypothetical protein